MMLHLHAAVVIVFVLWIDISASQRLIATHIVYN